MDERLKFIARLLDGEKMAAVCRDFNVSRKTGYKIVKRYNDVGLEGLTDRSRRPYRHANQLPVQIEMLIVRCKQDKPHWGAPKIREGVSLDEPRIGYMIRFSCVGRLMPLATKSKVACADWKKRDAEDHRTTRTPKLSTALSIAGRTMIWFIPETRASDAAVDVSCFGSSQIAGMPVAQAPPIGPSPLPTFLNHRAC
jgi:helix-turn-helix protein